MRICMLLYNFYEEDIRVIRYAEALAQRGDTVDIITLKKEGQPYRTEFRGVNVYHIQRRIPNESGKLSYLLKLLKFLFTSAFVLTIKHLRQRYDLVHVHSIPDFEVFAALFAKALGARIILDIHDIVPEFYANKFKTSRRSLIFKLLVATERVSIAFSDHVIISNDIWKEALVSRSVKEEKCTAMVNYFDPSIFYRRPRKRNDNKFIMLYPGSLNWHQGLDIAVRAFQHIAPQAPDAEFHIYGQGGAKPELEALIVELGLGNRVFLKESVSIEEIAEIMANVDLGVVPKRNDSFGGEAFSTKVFEFMALGVPVLVSRTKIDSYYFSQDAVRFFNPGDDRDLAEAMLELIRDKGLRQRLVRNSLRFVEQYNWYRRKEEYLALVDRLTGRLPSEAVPVEEKVARTAS